MNNKKPKLFPIISIVVLILFFLIGTYFCWQFFNRFQGKPELLKTFLESYGEGNSAVIFLCLQILQIIFPILPGEILEISAGYVFGPWLGLLLCEIGILLASFPIFIFVRKFGQKALSNFFDLNKFQKLKFLRTEKKLALVTFFLFFIPGTPKDLLTYFLGLTSIKPAHFLLITTLARIPSILTSTYVGANLGEENWQTALIVYTIFIIISLIGFVIYKFYENINRYA